MDVLLRELLDKSSPSQAQSIRVEFGNAFVGSRGDLRKSRAAVHAENGYQYQRVSLTSYANHSGVLFLLSASTSPKGSSLS